jgi:hypothetical protein
MVWIMIHTLSAAIILPSVCLLLLSLRVSRLLSLLPSLWWSVYASRLG